MSPNRRPLVILLILVSMLAVAGAAAYSYLNISQTDGGIDIPRKVADFILSSKIEGQEAIASTRQLHIGSVGTMVDAVIAVYLDPSAKRMHLWMSSFSNEKEAEDNLIRMVDSMSKRPELGYKPKSYPLKGLDVFVSATGGNLNVFWAQKNYVVYILIPGTALESSLDIASELISAISA